MTKEKFNVDINKLSSLNIYQLREVGSKIGVKNPTGMKTEELRNAIKMVVSGQVEPYEKIKSGRPHRHQIIKDEDWNRVIGFENKFNDILSNQNIFGSLYSVNGSQAHKVISNDFCGIAKFINNKLYILQGSLKKIDSSIYAIVDNNLPYANLIKESDFVRCEITKTDNKINATNILTINGLYPTDILRVDFDNMLPCSLGEQIYFNLKQNAFLNSICPIKLGQRVMIKGKLGSGQTYLTNSIAKDLENKYSVIFLATCKRPEERINLNQADYFFSTFDTLPKDSIIYFELACERAKRLCENGNNVVLIIDDIIMLMQIFRNLICEKIKDVENYYDVILQQFKKIFAISKNTKNGSLTLICAGSECNNEKFNHYLNELDMLCNCHIELNKQDYIQGKLEFYEKDKTYTEIIRDI